MVYIVSTPIGNLEDITLRAMRILKEVDFIICEDSRVTRILLEKYEIHKELIALNAGNEEAKIGLILRKLSDGGSCALVSDAGTPLISDPGVRLISALIKSNIPVSSIPGPSAVLTALTLSGLPADAFTFEGFIPQKKGRKTFIEALVEADKTIIFYESVYRIEKLLQEMLPVIPTRAIAICRELTKFHEEVWRGTVTEIHAMLATKTIKGEFVVVVAPSWWKIK
ncbi:MAG: 16S rRNA (cytidine(1402)-2'-O)-methyltransferase [Ignavibacteria bacterium]|nr:16S rRNA (cytidine(1402)-2'-O)-methyltransferase [Ignavibacteria bacterium]